MDHVIMENIGKEESKISKYQDMLIVDFSLLINWYIHFVARTSEGLT
jgi:hypothetical protein